MNKVIIRVLPSLELRQLEVADTASLFALTEANRTYLREWLPWLDHVTRPEGSQRFIEAAAKQAAEGTALALGILVENDLQGVIGYNQITPQNRCATIGYWIAEPMQGRGIMTAACQALVDYGFTHLGLNRQVIACAVGNRRSRGVPERIGFVCEGTAFEAEWLYEDFVDHAIYAQTRRQWEARRHGPSSQPQG